ncbi:unnamed protein product, partial [Symbiodinium microadriaticum]
MSMSSGQMWWHKIGQQEAHFIMFEETDIVATVKEKFISKSPSLQSLDPGQIIIRKASGEELLVDSKISQLVIQGLGKEPEIAVLVNGETSSAAGVATHPEVAPTAAAMRLSLCEEALGQVQPWQRIRCRIPYRSTDAGIKSRLADHIRQYTFGTLGGTVQRREDATVMTIEGTCQNIRAVLQWMEQTMRYPRGEIRKSLIVADEGTNVSSLSDALRPLPTGSLRL